MIKKNFLEKDIIYLDNASTTIPYSCDLPDNIWFNASASYTGRAGVKQILNQCKKDILKIFNIIDNGDVLFTSGATESNNIVVLSFVKQLYDYLLTNGLSKKYNMIVSPIEHPSVLNIYKEIEKSGIIDVRYMSVDSNGIVVVKKLKKLIDNNTILVSCMYVNNEIGVIQPIAEIGRICFNKNVCFHVDATQAIGKISIDCEKDYIDFLTFSAHKFHGPKGMGAVVCNHDSIIELQPLFFGGHQQESLRAGTENVPDIYIMTEILKDVCNINNIAESQHFSYIANNLLKGYLENHFNNDEYIINSNNFKIPIMNISFKNITGEYLVNELSKYNIYISAGSACTTGTFENSHVLEAMKVNSEFIEGTIRISFDPFDIDDKSLMTTVLKIKEIISK